MKNITYKEFITKFNLDDTQESANKFVFWQTAIENEYFELDVKLTRIIKKWLEVSE